MKRWKKLLIALITLCVFFISIIIYGGYRQYKDAVEAAPLRAKVAAIQKDENYAAYDEISPFLIKATIAVEDHRFYQHGGFDLLAIGRAVFKNLLGYGTSGGSTITQQLAKNLYFGYEPSFIRKIAELYVANDLESNYTKDEILTLYVNVINYGDNYIGIKAAAMGYFGVAPADLTLDQASLLAGLPQSPTNYQLSDHLAAAKKRQQVVLKAMVKANMITRQEMDEVLQK